MSTKEEADFVLGTVHSMKGQEAEDYVQLAADFQMKQLHTGVWFRPADRVYISAPSRERLDQQEEVRLVYTAASKARPGLFCNRLVGFRVEEKVKGRGSVRAMGLQVSQGGTPEKDGVLGLTYFMAPWQGLLNQALENRQQYYNGERSVRAMGLQVSHGEAPGKGSALHLSWIVNMKLKLLGIETSGFGTSDTMQGDFKQVQEGTRERASLL